MTKCSLPTSSDYEILTIRIPASVSLQQLHGQRTDDWQLLQEPSACSTLRVLSDCESSLVAGSSHWSLCKSETDSAPTIVEATTERRRIAYAKRPQIPLLRKCRWRPIGNGGSPTQTVVKEEMIPGSTSQKSKRKKKKKREDEKQATNERPAIEEVNEATPSSSISKSAKKKKKKKRESETKEERRERKRAKKSL